MNENGTDPHQLDVEADWKAVVRPNSGLKRAIVTRAHSGAGQFAARSCCPPGISMLIYAPRPEALDGHWDLPPVRRGVAGGRLCRGLVS
jgi:hypothetical protein